MVPRLTVRLGARSYWISFQRDLAATLRSEIIRLREAGQKIAVVTDENVLRAHASLLSAVFETAPTCVLPPGEATKSLKHLGEIWDFLAREAIDRRGALFLVGGGVVGDLGGFAAASYLRGVDFHQVPTTLLSMVDSSVGGKTGINISAGKNLVGSFHQPRAVYIAAGLLETLPEREFAAGMAEVLKYGLLGDADLFSELEGKPLHATSPELSRVIRRCCEMKAAIIQADEFETAAEGGRALLNLGHTFGHAIERVASYGTYLHGEAVAVGLAAAARLSEKLGRLSTVEVARVEEALSTHKLPARLTRPLPIADLMSAMSRDKKVRAGMPRFVILDQIGKASMCTGLKSDLVEQVWADVGAS